ncbi:MAG TPA: CoA pyrophosphatase [Bryobacteraceae bacterium]|nr:CoA pyrophosphatase [Bryobacteraceae bacterium]
MEREIGSECADAAVAIVRAGGAEESVLLIRRATRESDPWSGHWSFPGGRREAEDPDLVQTALRELGEECGIQLALRDLEGALPVAVARRRTPPFLVVAPFVFAVDGQRPTVLDPREAVEAVWVPLAALRDPARHRLGPVAGVPREMLFPAVEVNGWPLWGFTYRLISDWLGLEPEGTCSDAARGILDFLLSLGLRLRRGWTDGVAEVEGAIPVAEVVAEVSKAGCGYPAVNMVEVRADVVRVVGLAFEEMRIKGWPRAGVDGRPA